MRYGLLMLVLLNDIEKFKINNDYELCVVFVFGGFYFVVDY